MWFRKACWNTLGFVGGRRLGNLAFDNETLCYVDANMQPGVTGLFAMTIDDAPCLGGADESLVDELLQILAEYDARATFMICSDFVQGHEAGVERIVAAGHELANHMPADRAYNSDPREAVDEALDLCSATIQRFQPGRVRWFRAPHGKYSDIMKDCVRQRGMTNVMVDCYANDPHIADPDYISQFMLKHVQSGSVALIHMPSKSFRRWNLDAIRLFLEGTQQMNLKAVTVSTLYERSQGTECNVTMNGPCEPTVGEMCVASPCNHPPC